MSKLTVKVLIDEILSRECLQLPIKVPTGTYVCGTHGRPIYVVISVSRDVDISSNFPGRCLLHVAYVKQALYAVLCDQSSH